MHNLNPEYIVGLVDGEGSFTAYVRDLDDSKEIKRRTRIEPKFYIKLIEKDKKILFRLRKFFGCGSVYFQKDTRKNHQNCYRYEVSGRKDLEERIIPFFQRNVLQLPSKRYDFLIFCELMRRIRKDEHLISNGLRRLLRLKEKMH